MPLYPFCMKLITPPFEKPNKVSAGYMKQLKSTTHPKLQTAFSRSQQLWAKAREPVMR